MENPEFSIITPSFRNSSWLKLCIASVADQGVQLEHIVQDAGSDDGTLEWLPHDGRVRAYVEKDSGMYDAVNRGLRRARGQILAYLNCDEQYLAGALKKVSCFFQHHPEIDIVFADVIAVGNDGQFVCYRKVQLPSIAYTRAAVMLSTLTCATFFRRSVVDRHQLWFDTRYRIIGDADWVIRARRKGIPMAVLREYTSSFTLTGTNLTMAPNARRERAEFRADTPLLLRILKPVLVGHHRLRRMLDGAYNQKPFEYAIYTRSSPVLRQDFHAANPTHVWPA